jgi:serralysin
MSGNDKHYCVCISPQNLPAADLERINGHKAAILNGAKWDNGAIIRIGYMGGSVELQERVKQVALEWTRCANLVFAFGAADPEIRIAFTPGDGSWSYLGTVCQQIRPQEPTMNYGWLTDASGEEELRRVVLHEFGHAIGLIHEHQNPKGGIKWNEAAVKADLSGPPNKWDDATIYNNIFKKYEDVTATGVDPHSIMMYPIPKAWTIDGFSAGLNASISQQDRDLVEAVYPR